MDIGPVELLVVTFPGIQPDSAVVATVDDVVTRGFATVIDLVLLYRGQDGNLTVTEIDDTAHADGLGSLEVQLQPMLNDEDLELIAGAVPADQSAIAIVYEQTWVRRVSAAVVDAGGSVELHARISRDAALAALTPAAPHVGESA